MTRQLPDNSLVLLAYLPSRKDLEIARMLGWYRIPMRTAPKLIEVDYFAFYQGNPFGAEHRWQIEFIAEYRGHELTTRGDLLRDEPDHPRAREEYYKIQLGPLSRLDPPILAGSWKRITFLYTIGNLVNNASIVNDLVVQSTERESLWKIMREKAQRPIAYKTIDSLNPEFDPALLELIFGLNRELPKGNLDKC